MDTEVGVRLDIHKICRLCIRENDNLSSIFEAVLPIQIFECLSLEITSGDEKPSLICSLCLDQINNWYEFKQACKRSDAILDKYLKNVYRATNNVQCEAIVEVLVKNEKPFSWDNESDGDDYQYEAYQDSFDDKANSSDKYFDINTPVGYSNNTEINPSTSKSSQLGFFCKPCNIRFEEEPLLVNHKRIIHNGNKDLSCFYCNEISDSAIALIHHERTHREKPKRKKVVKRKPQSKRKKRSRRRKKHSFSESDETSSSEDNDDEGEQEKEGVTVKVEGIKPKEGDSKSDFVAPVINKKGKQVCLVCGKKFLCMAVLVTHERRVHLGEPVFQCQVCNKNYTTKRTLTTHMGSHNKEAIPCDVCGKKFSHKTLMAQHKVLVHSLVKPYSCTFKGCTKSFIRRYMLKTHQVVHTKEKNFNCEHCHKNFSRRESLKVHIRCHSSEPIIKYVPPRRYICTLCGKDYISPGELNRHELVTHKGERPFKCDQCDKGYASKFSLQVHQAIHQSERNHICELCGKSFNHSTRLSQHKSLVHHQGKPFKCFICSKSFLKPSLLKKHQVVHTGERCEKCHKCEKTFGTREGLKQHLKTHADIKRFFCISCNKRFAVNKSLKAHKCDGKPYVDKEKSVGCPTCGKMFISKKTLGRHMTLQRCAVVPVPVQQQISC